MTDISSRAASVELSSSLIRPLADRISKYSKLATTQNARPRTPISDDDTPKDVEDGDDSYVEDSEPEPETPAPGKKTAKQARRRRSRSGSANAQESKKGRATFPILTHRLTQFSTLPTIHEDQEHSTPFGDAPAHSTERARPNAVDVLSQICREVISNMAASLTTTKQQASAKNKRTALEAFGKDLDVELFDMSEAVESRIQSRSPGSKEQAREGRATARVSRTPQRKGADRSKMRCSKETTLGVRGRNETEVDAQRSSQTGGAGDGE